MLQRLIELLAPATCFGCGVEGDVICTTCLVMVPVRPGRCYGCNRVSVGGWTCEACRPASALTGVVVATDYEGAVKEAVLRLKFERSRATARVLAELVVGRLGGVEVDVVTAVPIAPVRYRERGYNQSELIAREVAKRLGLPYRLTLGRTTNEHQMGRRRNERLSGVAGVFYGVGRLSDERVLVVDDVITTGATLAECAAVLWEIGAGEVWGAVVARH
jgi:competence protein ComFC